MPATNRATPASLKTVLVTTVTPFDDSGSIRYDQLSAHCEYLVENGAEALIPCGNTGEFTSLSLDEAERVTAATAAAVAGRAVVIGGVGGPTPVAVDLARAAEAAGADAVMVHHPMHTYIHRRGLLHYYERIIDAVDIGVVLYKRGPELTDDVIATLVQHERVIGVKYAVNDVNAFANLVASSQADVTWICGTAERWAPFFFVAGATSFSSGLANFAPQKSMELFRLLEARRYAEAMEVRNDIVLFEELRQGNFSANNVSAVKAAMSVLGLCSDTVREPLLGLDDEGLGLVNECVEAWGTRPLLETA
ncbi:MAG: dihydrodipicolinate synthase family protein [Actinomycetota bacterium]